MNKQELYQQALRLKEERGWGGKRIGAYLGIDSSTARRWINGTQMPRKERPRVDLSPSPELAELLGILLGDGYIYYPTSYTRRRAYIGLSCKDEKLIEEFIRCSQAVGCTVGSVCRKRKTQLTQIRVYSMRVCNWYRSLSFNTINALGLLYPRDLLRGLFDSEGHVAYDKNHCEIQFTNKDRRVINLFTSLSHALGFSFRQRTRPDGIMDCRMFGKENICSFLSEIKPTIKRKQGIGYECAGNWSNGSFGLKAYPQVAGKGTQSLCPLP